MKSEQELKQKYSIITKRLKEDKAELANLDEDTLPFNPANEGRPYFSRKGYLNNA